MGKWLDFILTCRSGKDDTDYDIFIGGIANAKVFNTIELYFDNLINKEEAIRKLRFENPNRFVSGHRQLWNLICTLKGVNKFDGESYFTVNKHTRIIECVAEKEKLSLDDALCFFYHTKIYR